MIITNSKEMIEEILDFLGKENPEIIAPLKTNQLYRRAFVLVVTEFTEKKLKNFKEYSWKDKIIEMEREILRRI